MKKFNYFAGLAVMAALVGCEQAASQINEQAAGEQIGNEQQAAREIAVAEEPEGLLVGGARRGNAYSAIVFDGAADAAPDAVPVPLAAGAGTAEKASVLLELGSVEGNLRWTGTGKFLIVLTELTETDAGEKATVKFEDDVYFSKGKAAIEWAGLNDLMSYAEAVPQAAFDEAAYSTAPSALTGAKTSVAVKRDTIDAEENEPLGPEETRNAPVQADTALFESADDTPDGISYVPYFGGSILSMSYSFSTGASRALSGMAFASSYAASLSTSATSLAFSMSLSTSTAMTAMSTLTSLSAGMLTSTGALSSGLLSSGLSWPAASGRLIRLSLPTEAWSSWSSSLVSSGASSSLSSGAPSSLSSGGFEMTATGELLFWLPASDVSSGTALSGTALSDTTLSSLLSDTTSLRGLSTEALNAMMVWRIDMGAMMNDPGVRAILNELGRRGMANLSDSSSYSSSSSTVSFEIEPSGKWIWTGNGGLAEVFSSSISSSSFSATSLGDLPSFPGDVSLLPTMPDYIAGTFMGINGTQAGPNPQYLTIPAPSSVSAPSKAPPAGKLFTWDVSLDAWTTVYYPPYTAPAGTAWVLHYTGPIFSDSLTWSLFRL